MAKLKLTKDAELKLKMYFKQKNDTKPNKKKAGTDNINTRPN
jgi:hypothetical protein